MRLISRLIAKLIGVHESLQKIRSKTKLHIEMIIAHAYEWQNARPGQILIPALMIKEKLSWRDQEGATPRRTIIGIRKISIKVIQKKNVFVILMFLLMMVIIEIASITRLTILLLVVK